MRLRYTPALVALTLLLAGNADGGNGAIGIYFDPECASCGGTASFGVPFTLYVNATLAGQTAGGTSGAQFSISGVPSTWFKIVTPNPQASATNGDLLGVGCAIAFQPCMAPPGGCVNLYTILLVPTTVVQDVRLTVHKVLTRWEPPWDLPELYGCEPDFTRFLVDGGTAILNGPPCTVATASMTWSNVKALYRGVAK